MSTAALWKNTTVYAPMWISLVDNLKKWNSQNIYFYFGISIDVIYSVLM
jgi:hypothetical protein